MLHTEKGKINNAEMTRMDFTAPFMMQNGHVLEINAAREYTTMVVLDNGLTYVPMEFNTDFHPLLVFIR